LRKKLNPELVQQLTVGNVVATVELET